MSYHRFNNFPELFHGYLTERVGRGIISSNLINRSCNCLNPYKVYKEKYHKECLIYEEEFALCGGIYIG